MSWLAPSRVPGDARLRHDDRDPTSRQPATAQKNKPTPPGKSQNITTPPLIRWSIQEIRRIAIRLARKRIQPAHIIAWSYWRRAHQAALNALTSNQSNCNARSWPDRCDD